MAAPLSGDRPSLDALGAGASILFSEGGKAASAFWAAEAGAVGDTGGALVMGAGGALVVDAGGALMLDAGGVPANEPGAASSDGALAAAAEPDFCS